MLDAKVFSCKMRLFQKSEGRKWAAMGRTCLRSPFCPRTPWPGSSTLSLAGGAESGLAFWGIQTNYFIFVLLKFFHFDLFWP